MGNSAPIKYVGGVVAIAAIFSLAACAPAEPDGASTPSPSQTQIMPPGATDEPDAGDGPRTAASLPTQEAAVGETIAFDTGISIVVEKVEALAVEAQTPGEVSGSAVAVTVTATNGTDQAQSLDSAVVTVEAADGEPGIGTTAGDPVPFVGELAPGKTASGRYVYMLDSASGRDITVSVNYGAGEPVALFTGKVSG